MLQSLARLSAVAAEPHPELALAGEKE